MNLVKLVNKKNPLSSDFIPLFLKQDPISKVWLCNEVLHAFNGMNTALAAEHLEPLALISGYRPYDYQQKLYDRKVGFFISCGLSEESSRQKAGSIVALPGCSEHQLGLAADVTAFSMKQQEDPLTEAFAFTPEGIWLSQNAHHYGFVLRYPKDKMSITEITYEPWHYRYVGRQHALSMYALHMCLEEYVLII